MSMFTGSITQSSLPRTRRWDQPERDRSRIEAVKAYMIGWNPNTRPLQLAQPCSDPLNLPMRRMAQVKDVLENYPLSRDFVDFNRLNLQHYLWKDIFSYNIHPKILERRCLLKVADVGTGTGYLGDTP
ncbi:hypothetical protein F5Y12DRAFT_764947 [Xylaria sp. FL1777]|nr:hypothetical protein F5Y12DRAFT_764947 [Xylaria sp. FL1777]